MGTPLDLDLRQVELRLKADLANCSDVVYRTIAVEGGLACLLVYLEGMVNLHRLERSVMSTLLYHWERDPEARLTAARDGMAKYLSRQVLPATRLWVIATYTELYDHLLEGDVLLLTGGPDGALALRLEDEPERQTEEPITEPVIRGPREGFTEMLRTNTALLRRRLRSKHFKLEKLTVGSVSRSGVIMAYLSDIAEPELVAEVRTRLSQIQIDGVLESGYLEEFLEDHPFSPFSQVQNTERPDVAAAAILEGRVCILTEGTPFVLIVPVTFFTLVQANEDYYERFLIGSFVRLLRYGLLITALLFPSIYIAITTYHQEMIPTNLLVTLASAREGVPFPALLEVALMEVAFEALREAGLRLPQPVGQSLSFVGALVIGQAIVQAGIVSAPVVIVVAITGIGTFSAPRYNAALPIRLLRFPLMFLGAWLGLFGVVSGLLLILIHLCAMHSFGVPYFAPLSPLIPADLKDVLYRAPHWAMRLRPRIYSRRKRQRVPPGQKPSPAGAGQSGGSTS